MAKIVNCSHQNGTGESSGEAKAYISNFFRDNLDKNWIVYIEPFFNGQQPDIVLLHPEKGIMVWEIDLSPDDPELALRRAVSAREAIINLYIPTLGVRVSQENGFIKALKVGLYIPSLTRKEILNKISKIKNSQYASVVGKDGVEMNQAPFVWNTECFKAVPERLELVEAFKTWLNPPYHKSEMGRPVRLSRHQQVLATCRSGHIRVRGAAGSGKTLTLAHRAANIASSGKKVLVVTFNITMWHHIRELMDKIPQDFDFKKLVFTHFHEFCLNELNRMGIERDPYHDKREDIFFQSGLPNLVKEALESGSNLKWRREKPVFDAILIDEGQDFCWNWYDLLSSYLSPNNELVLFTDSRQNIYGRESWIDKPMRKVQFRGAWNELKDSFRIKGILVDELNRFATQYMTQNSEDVIVGSGQMSLYKEILIWEDVAPYNAKETCLSAYEYFFSNGVSPSDITILVMDKKFGLDLVNTFRSKGMNVNHIFDPDPKNQKTLKEFFWMKNLLLKICTVHSYKGWESRCVILAIPDESNMVFKRDTVHSIVYTGMSRALDSLCVINCSETYRGFGKEWDRLPNIASAENW
ncbi:MAG: AAA family ATPase [Thermotogaceae bacterium]|nr:AAA family ATPase [Thermotogaceae bacterium]